MKGKTRGKGRMRAHGSARARRNAALQKALVRSEKLEPRVLLANGLVLAYGFEENGGTGTADASGSNNNGTLNGASWTTAGKFGNALSFNGTSNWVTVADAASLDVTTAITMEAWVYPTTANGLARDVLIKEGTGLDIYNLYARDDLGKPETNLHIGSGSPGVQGAALPLNTWTHLAGTYNGSSIVLYANGTVVGAVNATGAIATSNGALRIGGNSIWGEYFQGKIDEVRLYNRALSQSEIQTDMNTAVQGAADTTPPLVSSYTPLNGAANVATNVNVTVTFSEAMLASSINSSTIELRDPNNVLVPAAVTYNSTTKVATLDPTNNLASASSNSYYSAVVHGGSSGVKDAAGNPLSSDVFWAFTTGAPTFQDSVVFSGLTEPSNIAFASDGRIFVAEKRGVIKVFHSLSDTNPTTFCDLRTQVHNFWDRGLLGMTLAPNFPVDPYVYVLYSADADIGGTAPKFGTANTDTDPGPNATTTGATISARLSRLQASGDVMVGSEQVLINDWFQQFPSHSIGTLLFGPDGMLYAGAGDGASFNDVDSGQFGGNPGGDPTNEGGALRAQDLRTSGDAVTLDGGIIRIDPNTFQPPVSMTVGTPTTDANGVKSYTVTSPYLGNVPTTVRVLTPTNPAAGVPHRTLYVLPVEAGLTSQSSQYNDGLEQLRLLNVANQYNATLIAPSFNIMPWIGDNPADSSKRLESFIVRDLVPWVNKIEPASATHERWLIGFSKSGNASLDLILRHPNLFSAAAIWDSPAELTSISADPDMSTVFGTEANFDTYEIPTLLTTNGSQFKTSTRLWISGDNAVYTTQMQQLHTQMQSAGILHTWVTGTTRAHSWASGWLSGAVAGLAGTNKVLGSSDLNEQRIIAEGLRNPFRWTFRPGTSEMWIGDVGWNDWEEIDRMTVQPAGALTNFGWPAYEGNGRQSGYDAANIPVIEGLYNDPSAVTYPYYTYNHTAQVVPGSGEPTGGSSISGMAFYNSGSYPVAYNGALFFADYSRGSLYVMFRGPNGDPDPTNIARVPVSAGPVQLMVGPGGDIFYADLQAGVTGGGKIHRLQYFGANRPPTAVITSDKTSGPSPLTVNFSGTSSSDPDPGDTLSYAWDLDNNGQFNDSTSATPQYTFTTSGNKTVRLQVTDNHGASSTTSILISVDNTPPVPVIDSPGSMLSYKVGDVINFSGHATDTQDVTLPASAFSWALLVHHNTHVHHIQDFVGVSSGSFTAPDHDYPSFLELDLTVTDSGGLSTTTSVNLQPQTVNLTFNSVPSGLTLTVGSASDVTPFVRTVIANSTNTISASSPQVLGGTSYYFSNWNDGGSASHVINAPATSATYTANFTSALPPVAAWNFDETSGATAADATGHGNTGTITNATHATTGKYNGALSFNGTNSFVTVADSAWLDLTTAMTLEAWVNPTSTTGLARDVIIKEGSGVDEYNLYSRDDLAKPETNLHIGTGSPGVQGATIPVNAWTHLAATYNGSTLILYVNGVAAASTPATGSIETSTGALRIGGNSIWGEYFAGMIDDVRIYNQALTQTQIQNDMNTPVSSAPVNHAPTASFTASPQSGNAPLTVNFNATASSDPDAGDTISYAWDLDNDGAFDDSTSATPSWQFTTAGSNIVRLQVTDNHGAVSNTASTTISVSDPNNTPPTMFIDTPLSSLTWKVGDVIGFSGHATDSQDPSIPASSITWQMILHQGATTQVLQTYNGVASGSFTVPNEPYPSYLELKGTATDSGGLQGTNSIQLNPQTTTLNFATSPTGLQLTVNGTASTAPFSRTVIVSSVNPVIAGSPQTIGSNTYFFGSWSDSGSATHNITAPAGGGTYTATYTTGPTPVASYNFNATSGTTLADISGNGNNGTVNGATWITTGHSGNALNFNGTSNYVLVPDANSLDLTSGMTLEAWVYPTSNNKTRNVIMKEGTGVDVYSLYARDDQQKLEGNITVAGGGAPGVQASTPAINTWTHVATTYDGTSIKLFVNGAQVATAPASGLIQTTSGALRIGGNSIWGEWFAGRIDDLRIYNVALTAAQITNDMNAAVAAPALAPALDAAALLASPTNDSASTPPAPSPSPGKSLFSTAKIKSAIELIAD